MKKAISFFLVFCFLLSAAVFPPAVAEEADLSGEVTLVIRARTAEDSEQIVPEEQLFAIKTNSETWRGIRLSIILDGREKEVRKLVAKDGGLYSTEEVYIGRF